MFHSFTTVWKQGLDRHFCRHTAFTCPSPGYSSSASLITANPEFLNIAVGGKLADHKRFPFLGHRFPAHSMWMVRLTRCGPHLGRLIFFVGVGLVVEPDDDAFNPVS